MDNSASETDFQILNQLRTNIGDGQSQMEGVELIDRNTPSRNIEQTSPTRNMKNATLVEDSRPGEAFIDHNGKRALMLHSMQDREEVGILAASLSNIEK